MLYGIDDSFVQFLFLNVFPLVFASSRDFAFLCQDRGSMVRGQALNAETEQEEGHRGCVWWELELMETQWKQESDRIKESGISEVSSEGPYLYQKSRAGSKTSKFYIDWSGTEKVKHYWSEKWTVDQKSKSTGIDKLHVQKEHIKWWSWAQTLDNKYQQQGEINFMLRLNVSAMFIDLMSFS